VADSRDTNVLPDVSIVMAAYNEEDCIGRALDSIRAQTLSNWELIVIDDGSTDATREIVQRYVAQDQRIILVSNEKNLRLSLSLNRGIGLARANLIARADADDLNLPKRLAMQCEFLRSHPEIDVLGTGAYLLDKRNRITGLLAHPLVHADLEGLTFLEMPFAHPSVMIRRSFFLKAGLYDPYFPNAEDKELWLRGLRFGCRYANLPDPLINYQTDDFIKSWGSIARHAISLFKIVRKYRLKGGYLSSLLMTNYIVAIKLRLYKPKALRMHGLC
jgi:glycosyltransferase involved in cell wall biosynthesis